MRTHLNLVRRQLVLIFQHLSTVNQPLPVLFDLRLFLDLCLELGDGGIVGRERESELEL
jgi:hypothetical protein